MARGLVWNGDSIEDRSEKEEYPKEDQKWVMTRLLALVLQHSNVLHPVPIHFHVGTLIMFFISSLVIVATKIFYYCNLQVRPLNLKLEYVLTIVHIRDSDARTLSLYKDFWSPL